MFSKILIANRGEIACRIARSARQMGIGTVAVYSDADRDALHVQACDEAVCIGKSPPTESYLLGDRIIEAALNTAAPAIHPGFGFLSENADFAQSCADQGLVFIGPNPEAIRNMGSKSAARRIMQEAGVPVLPGYDGDNQDDTLLAERARETGFPLLIKAVAGGGGKGLRAVDTESEFISALGSVRRESLAAFADDAVLLERYLPKVRHIEIQIFADTSGNVVHLFERDCSLQRRHQKVIEEAPAPGINDRLREEMAKAAILCAKATAYVGAGTVEFLLAPDNTFYFMEMNTRLQVEHPVPEMIARQDLVAWQFKIAAGETLPVDQGSLSIKGHSVEARIYAENPQLNFLPSIGKLDFLQPPDTSGNIRIDSGVIQGDEISAHYDPMIAKLICWGENRDQAMTRLASALGQYRLIGPKNNINFLSRLCSHRSVLSGGVNTRFIDTHLDELISTDSSLDENALVSAAIFLTRVQNKQIQAQQKNTADPWSPWADSGGWRPGRARPRQLSLQYEEQLIELGISEQKNAWTVEALEKHYRIEALASDPPYLNLQINGLISRCIVIQTGATIRLLRDNEPFTFTILESGNDPADSGPQRNRILSPMPGKIIACHVRTGQSVRKGETLMIIEAMKMEHSIQATHEGEIANVYFALDDQVEEGETLLTFKDSEEPIQRTADD